MPCVLSIMGGMAVGKTTLLKQIEQRMDQVEVSFEDISVVNSIVKSRKLDKYNQSDFVEIQKLFIEAEIERYEKMLKQSHRSVIIFDLGAKEIEFYTKFFPKSIGCEWNVCEILQNELSELCKCYYNGILYLDASDETLRKRMSSDKSRKRGFFEHYLESLHPYKKTWIKNITNITIINTDNLNEDDTLDQAMKWIKRSTT